MRAASGTTALAVWFWMLSGCSQSEPPPLTEERRTEQSSTRVIRNATVEESSSKTAPKVARPTRPIVVGGCQEQCEEVQSAFRSYLQAAFSDPSGEAAIPFLETSEMVFNGERKGDRWVSLWESRELEKRRVEIEAFSQSMHSWIGGTSPDDLEVSLANGVRFSEDDGPGYLAHYSPPTRSLRPGQKKEWIFRIQRRGWEWLIASIQTRELDSIAPPQR